MINFNILYIFLLFFGGCKSNKERQTLHNYPYFEDMECPQSFSLDNENMLKAKAKALNMRYVDYLHFLSNKMKPESVDLTLGTKE